MFDPYHKWLGIPNDQRPPTHYQLLGVAEAEQDAEVIEEAAIRQATHVRSYQLGPHAADCARILKEIASARLTLLNPTKRKEYNKRLASGRADSGHADEPLPQSTQENGVAVMTGASPMPTIQAAAPPVLATLAQPMDFGAPAEEAGSILHTASLPAHRWSAELPIGLIIGVGVAVVMLLVLVIGVGGAIFYLSTQEPPPKQDVPVAHKKPEGSKPIIVDVGPMKKLNADPKKVGESAPPKEEMRTIEITPPPSPQVSKPSPQDPKPAGPPVTVVPDQGKPAAKLILEIPRDRIAPLLSSDGSILAYQIPKNGHLGYRKSPAFAVEKYVKVQTENTWIIPAAASYDGKKMALRCIRGQEFFDTERILLFDWTKLKVESWFATAGRPAQVIFSPDMKYLAASSSRVSVGMSGECWLQLYRIGPPVKGIGQWNLKDHLGWFGFTPDGTQFAFADQEAQTARTYDVKTSAEAEERYFHQRKRHTLSSDFSLCVIQAGAQVQICEIQPHRVRRTIRGLDARTRLEADTAAFSPDNGYLLVGTHDKPQGGEGRVSLVDLKDGKVVSAIDDLPGKCAGTQLAANGMAIVHYDHPDNSIRSRLYRFPMAPGDPGVKNDPPVPNAESYAPLFNGNPD